MWYWSLYSYVYISAIHDIYDCVRTQSGHSLSNMNMSNMCGATILVLFLFVFLAQCKCLIIIFSLSLNLLYIYVYMYTTSYPHEHIIYQVVLMSLMSLELLMVSPKEKMYFVRQVTQIINWSTTACIRSKDQYVMTLCRSVLPNAYSQ